MNERLFFFDCETGGLKPQWHPLLEIAARCELHEDDPGGTDFSVAFRQDPAHWERCEPRALHVNQFTFEELERTGLPYHSACSSFLNWLMENNIQGSNIIWVGQNPNFDAEFLANNMDPYLRFVDLLNPVQVINTMDLARRLMKLDSTFKPASLSGASIALALGLIPEDNVHRAMGGVYAVRQNYYALMKRLPTFEPVKE